MKIIEKLYLFNKLFSFISSNNLNLQKADKEPYKINSGAKSEARLPAVYRAHHNARILCVMEHPTLKTRQNSSLLLDVQCKRISLNDIFIFVLT